MSLERLLHKYLPPVLVNIIHLYANDQDTQDIENASRVFQFYQSFKWRIYLRLLVQVLSFGSCLLTFFLSEPSNNHLVWVSFSFSAWYLFTLIGEFNNMLCCSYDSLYIYQMWITHQWIQQYVVQLGFVSFSAFAVVGLSTKFSLFPLYTSIGCFLLLILAHILTISSRQYHIEFPGIFMSLFQKRIWIRPNESIADFSERCFTLFRKLKNQGHFEAVTDLCYSRKMIDRFLDLSREELHEIMTMRLGMNREAREFIHLFHRSHRLTAWMNV